MRILLTGTRAPATLDLARRLWREGCTVIGADSLRFPLGRYSRAFAAHHFIPRPRQQSAEFLNALLGLVEQYRIDLLWPTCEEIFHVAASHEVLSERTRLFCDPLGQLERLHHKGNFVELVNAMASAVRAPCSWPAEAAPEQCALVWKPYYSRFAAKTRFDAPPKNLAGWMAQERIVGREFCSWSLVEKGGVRVMTFYESAVRAGRGAGCAFAPMWDEDAAQFVRELAAGLSLTGAVAFDFIRSHNGGIYVIECNPRMTSGIHVLDESVSISGALRASVPLPPPMHPAQLWLPVWLKNRRLAGSSPDVISHRDDPSPAWNQAWEMMEFGWRALRQGISLLEATTWDIEYNG